MNRFKMLLNLYWSFFKIGGLTFGGGLTMLPMLEHELVQNKKWVTEEELLDCYAIGQCTPGIIAVNTATFVGCKKGKVLGGIFSTLGMVTPSLVIITVAAMFLQLIMGNEIFQHAMMGIRSVVCALMVNTVLNLIKKSIVSYLSCAIFALVLAAGLFFKIPTIFLVLAATTVGIIIELINNPPQKKNKEDKNV